jgi:hypothetical protein
MTLEIWVGFVELRQLPGTDHKVTLLGKGAFTWITCWASDSASFERKVSEVITDYGLFVVGTERVMPFARADEMGLISDELAEQFDDTCKNENFCIYGTFYSYKNDD